MTGLIIQQKNNKKQVRLNEISYRRKAERKYLTKKINIKYFQKGLTLELL